MALKEGGGSLAVLCMKRYLAASLLNAGDDQYCLQTLLNILDSGSAKMTCRQEQLNHCHIEMSHTKALKHENIRSKHEIEINLDLPAYR